MIPSPIGRGQGEGVLFPCQPMPNSAPRSYTRRSGLTLVEVILVLSLLIIVSAVSVPLLTGAFSSAGLYSASDLLRGALSSARLAAMQSGQPYAFRCELRGGRFQIAPLDQLGLPEAQESQPEDPDAEHAATDILRLSRNRLPDGVIFANGDVSNSNMVAATMGSISDSAWSPPILFRPDGTCSDASLLLQNDQAQTVRVSLRGLTGISSASDIGHEAVQ
jgi:type II secretory pathway pseudopilin PulG